jgi:hypothetical protein
MILQNLDRYRHSKWLQGIHRLDETYDSLRGTIQQHTLGAGNRAAETVTTL